MLFTYLDHGIKNNLKYSQFQPFAVLLIIIMLNVGENLIEARSSTRAMQHVRPPKYSNQKHATPGFNIFEDDQVLGTDATLFSSTHRSLSYQSPIESNSIQKLYESTSTSRSVSDSRFLKRVFLSNRTVTCNDGSQAGFYLRKSTFKSKRWVVFLEGGWHCFDTESCRVRWNKNRNLMTSAKWPEKREEGEFENRLNCSIIVDTLFHYFSRRNPLAERRGESLLA